MTRQIVLKSRPAGFPTRDNFELKMADLPAISAGQVRLVPHTFSVDPYLRGRMGEAPSYIAPFQIGEPIIGGGVALVSESKVSGIEVGNYVMGYMPWQEEIVTDAIGLMVVDKNIAPLSYYLGILGMPGLTAWFGLLDIGKPKSGETVVISGAAGAVGIVAGQIAKIHGCNVIGITGDDSKADYLIKELKFDSVINYKTTYNGFEKLPDAFIALFEGKNLGKLIVEV